MLVIGETPSLGRSIIDLLQTEDITAQLVYDVVEEAPLATLHHRYPLLIAASNTSHCATAHRWARGELPDLSLIVIGARDPELQRMSAVRVVPLPLRPEPFLTLVRSLLPVDLRTNDPTGRTTQGGGPPARPCVV